MLSSSVQQQLLHSVSNLHLLLSSLQVRQPPRITSIQSVCECNPLRLAVVPGRGGPAGQLHRGAAAGPERALLLLLLLRPIPAVLAAQLAGGAGEAAQPGEAAPGAGLPAETTGGSR